MACALAIAQTVENDTSLRASGDVFFTTAQDSGVAMSLNGMNNSGPVQGAPYSALIAIESVQTLADGNRIVAKTSGLIARDSLGRIRQEMALPAIGNLSARDIPQIVFIQDPAAHVSYTLNLTNKTAHTMPGLPVGVTGQGVPGLGGGGQPGAAVVVKKGPPMAPGGSLPVPGTKAFVFVQKDMLGGEQGQTTSADLGSQMIEGVLAIGTRTTLMIPAGQIGNDKAISVVTEVWTSPELKTIVSSKQSDPRVGDRTFQLTNIARTEPDPSLFTVPSDFTMITGPEPVLYGPKK
jgi:hypothetical protein